MICLCHVKLNNVSTFLWTHWSPDILQFPVKLQLVFFVKFRSKCNAIFLYILKVFENSNLFFMYCRASCSCMQSLYAVIAADLSWWCFSFYWLPFFIFINLFMFTNPYWAGYHAFSVWNILDNHFLNNCWRKPKQQDVINTFVCISIS